MSDSLENATVLSLIEQKSTFNFSIEPGETNEEFLGRFSEYLNLKNQETKQKVEVNSDNISLKKKVSIDDLMNDPANRADSEKAMSIVLANENSGKAEIYDPIKNEIAFDLFKTKVSTGARDSSGADDVLENQMYYGETNQSRSFFPRKKRKKHDDIPYAMSLFGVGLDDSQVVQDYFKSKMNGKNIGMFGGGRSCRDLIESDTIKPHKIINADPYINEVEGSPSDTYQVVSMKADDTALAGRIRDQYVEGFHELWLSYSVPFYNKGTEEIKNVFTNIKSLLLVDGNCRITPLDVQSETEKSQFVHEVRSLIDSKEYNIHVLGYTLIIHKLSAVHDENKENSHANDERINAIKNQIESELSKPTTPHQ